MMTRKLGVTAVAVGLLAVPAAGLADSVVAGPTPLVGPANQTALAQPFGLGPIATPQGPCVTHVRWVKPLGTEGGHWVAACPQQASWVPARGPAGGHYDYAPTRCVRWVPPRGVEGGHYVGTCSPQPRWVPAHGTLGGHYEYVGASTTEGATKPIATAVKASGVPSSGFDWGSAGIGAAGVIGALAIAIAAISGLRGQRVAGPRTP